MTSSWCSDGGGGYLLNLERLTLLPLPPPDRPEGRAAGELPRRLRRHRRQGRRRVPGGRGVGPGRGRRGDGLRRQRGRGRRGARPRHHRPDRRPAGPDPGRLRRQPEGRPGAVVQQLRRRRVGAGAPARHPRRDLRGAGPGHGHRGGAVRRHQPRRQAALHLVPLPRPAAAQPRLRHPQGPHLHVLRRRPALPVRLRPELHDLRDGPPACRARKRWARARRRSIRCG